MSRPALQAHQILTDATTIATLIAPALANLDLGLAGWPTTTPGASPAEASGSAECPRRDCTNERPCHTHGDDVTLTATERHGLAPDKARLDLEALQEALRTMAHHGAIAATICARWGYTGVTETDVKRGLAERIDQIWCANCAKAGISTVHLEGRTECRFCESVRQNGACGVVNPNHHPAPRALLEIHATRRLNSADVVRCMTATYGDNWNRKIKKGRAA